MHCAAVNNHTDIIEYIINDLQMKELDKEDNVSIWLFFSFLSYFNCKTLTQIEGNDPHFSRETGLSAWLQRTAVWTCWRCCGSNTTWTPWSPTRCVFLVCGDSFFLSIQNIFPSIELLLLWNAHLKISKSNRLWCRLCPSLPASLPPPLPPSHQAGDTPLHLAASNGHLDTVHLLLLHFDTRDEANAVWNQRKHPLQPCVFSG